MKTKAEASSSSVYASLLLCVVSAAAGAAVSHLVSHLKKKTATTRDPETDHSIGHELIWNSIGGAMNAAMLHVGDRLKLYQALRELCRESENSHVTAISLAEHTGLNQRWLREWLAQQAGMGVLKLFDGTGDDDASLKYRLPMATASVFADPLSTEYDISMIQMVPSLVNRAKTMLPEAFATGIGRPYDDADISEAIDRHHAKHVRDYVIPVMLPSVRDGGLVDMLEDGIDVADLGCGAGVLLVHLAKQYPKSTFHGFEISSVALERAAFNVAKEKLSNVVFHDANEQGESLEDFANTFELVLTYDVLHDSTQPQDLIRQVKIAMKPKVGLWLLADLPAQPSVRDNLKKLSAAPMYYSLSTCLCMSCALSEPDGAGLGSLGFSVPKAQEMLTNGGFSKVQVLAENKDNARWFLVEEQVR